MVEQSAFHHNDQEAEGKNAHALGVPLLILVLWGPQAIRWCPSVLSMHLFPSLISLETGLQTHTGELFKSPVTSQSNEVDSQD